MTVIHQQEFQSSWILPYFFCFSYFFFKIANMKCKWFADFSGRKYKWDNNTKNRTVQPGICRKMNTIFQNIQRSIHGASEEHAGTVIRKVPANHYYSTRTFPRSDRSDGFSAPYNRKFLSRFNRADHPQPATQRNTMRSG